MNYDMLQPGTYRDKKSKSLVFIHNKHFSSLKNELKDVKMQLQEYKDIIDKINKRIEKIEKPKTRRKKK